MTAAPAAGSDDRAGAVHPLLAEAGARALVVLSAAGEDPDRSWFVGSAKLGEALVAYDAARAVMASEDQRFIAHHGIDFVQLDEALADYRDGDDLRGASTITQQVAKNLFLWQGRSFVRKGLEAYFAVLLELCLPKERILEIYLNVAEFGPHVFGVEAAAHEYFGKSAASLRAPEAALLAAVLPNPKRLLAARPSDYVRERQDWIEAQMRLLESRGHYRGIDW